MDIAIVTGAETPLGLRTVQSLIQQGCRVHGIGNNFSRVTYADRQFKAHPVDLTDLDAVASTLGKILEEEQRLDVLIHAIDVTPGTAFDKLPPGNLEAILKIGLLGPVMMTRLALPNLLRFRGQLINIITSNKHGHKASAANALIEGGLREMNHALFDQGRDAGLRITNCVLRQNSELAAAKISDDALAQSHIDLEDVARTIEQLIDPKAVNVPAEVVLHPRLSAKAEEAQPKSILPLDAYSEVVLPPKEYCPPEQPKIPTAEKQQIERTIPYTDEEMEEKIAAAIEDYEAHPERYDQPDPAPAKQRQGGQRQSKPRQGNPQQGNPEQGDPQQDGQGNNKRRRRRRGGRNRNRNNQEGGASNQDDSRSAPQEKKKPQEGQPKQKPDSSKKPNRTARKSDQNKPAQKTPKDSATEKPAAKASTVSTNSGQAASTNSGQAGSPREKPVKKRATKKAAKKAVKKIAKKKTVKQITKVPADPAAKKTAAKKTARKRAVKKVVSKE